MTINKNFGLKLRELRKEAKLSLPLLAKRAKIAKGNLSRIENGKNLNPEVNTLLKLLHFLDCSPADFFEMLTDFKG